MDEIDETSDYATGAKTQLVISVYPSDGVATTDSSPYGYCFNQVESNHNCDVESYLAERMAVVDDYFASASWGVMTLTSTITPPYQIDYTGATCADVSALSFGCATTVRVLR